MPSNCFFLMETMYYSQKTVCLFSNISLHANNTPHFLTFCDSLFACLMYSIVESLPKYASIYECLRDVHALNVSCSSTVEFPGRQIWVPVHDHHEWAYAYHRLLLYSVRPQPSRRRANVWCRRWQVNPSSSVKQCSFCGCFSHLITDAMVDLFHLKLQSQPWLK